MKHRMAQTGRWAGVVLLMLVLGACSFGGGKREAALSRDVKLQGPLAVQTFAQLPRSEQIRYFTDNVYYAATHQGAAGEARAVAAAEALGYLQENLGKEDFVRFWIGVDGEFFGRVNADLDFPDYTRPQTALDARRVRTAYNLAARHLEVLSNLGEARRRAMTYMIELAGKGDGEACFAFHKAYKDYADPREGEAGVTWQQADGKPFRKSMWAGSAEASLDGRVARIAIPAEVVLGCRNILHPPAAVTAGRVEEVKQYFSGIQLSRGFDLRAYSARKETWRKDITQQALSASEKLRLQRIRIVNVVDVYQIFPPELDYEYELAASDGTLPEMVAAGILDERDAFAVEQRIHERKVLLTGVGVTPQDTPMAFLQMVSERASAKK